MSDRDEQRRADLSSLRIQRDPVRRAPRRRRRWWIPVVLVLIATAAAGIWAVRGRPVPVGVAYATRTVPGDSGPLPVLSGSGYIVTGDRYVSVGVRVAGRIDHYFVEEGQSVKKSEPLVQLDDRDYRAAVAATEARIASARANMSLADADLARGRSLRSQGVISQQEFDVLENKAAVARAAIQQLEAELSETKVNLDYTTLRAPADGVVLAKLKEVGEIAVPGGFAGSGDLVRLANLTDMRAEVDVNEADLNRVHLGQPATVTPDAYPDARYAAAVVKLYPQVDRQKGIVDRSRQFSQIPRFIPQEFVEGTQEPDVVDSEISASPLGHDSLLSSGWGCRDWRYLADHTCRYIHQPRRSFKPPLNFARVCAC
jgi:HlyD family secretion protein